MASLKDIQKDIASENYAPVYFLHGPEMFFTEQAEQAFVKGVIADDQADFNKHVLYGKETDLDSVLKLAAQFPMMGERQLVIVKEAQNYRKFDLLEKYLENPVAHTVLVFSYKGKKLDARIEKKLKACKFLLSTNLYDNQVPAWIEERVHALRMSIEPKAVKLLSEYLGNHLGKIDNELQKLKLALPEAAVISVRVIEDHIGISKDYNVFELTGALAQRDAAKSVKIAVHFAKNSKNHPFVVTCSSIYSFFSKVLQAHFVGSTSPQVLAKALGVSPYFVKDYQVATIKYSRKEVAQNIHTLLAYDEKSKGLNNRSTDEGALLKELVIKLVN